MKKIGTLLFLLILCKQTLAANWVAYDNNRWYDSSSVQRLPNQHIQVWVKAILSKNITTALEKDLRKIGMDVSYVNYGYSISRFQYSCSDITSTTTAGTDYKKNGEVINSFNVPSRPMQPVIPESNGGTLYEILCK